ncbi:hypothetical protein MAR_015479, partial [Mya arenaria]
MYGASLDGDNLPDIIAEEEFPNKVLDFELPLLIGAGLGIIATLLLVPITLCVCCCRCCGRCGGSITSADIGKHKKACQIANGVILLACIGIVGAMAFCVPMSVDRLTGSPGIVLESVEASIEDVITFLHMFLKTDGHSFCDDLPQGGEQSLDVPTQETSSIFSLLPEMIRNSSGDALSSAVSTLDTVPDELDGMVVDILHNFNFSSSDIGLENMLEPVKDGVDLIEDFKPKVFLGSAVLGGWLGVLCVMVLVVSALDTADLPGLADNLTSLADNLTHQDYKSAYEALALNVTFLHTSQEGPLRTQLATLESLLDDVELALTSMKEDVTRLTGSVENITNYIT